MKFLEPHLQEEFEHVHPETRSVLLDLDKWSAKEGLPEVVVTHVHRTVAGSISIYGVYRFSWHMCWCAVDIRNRHYTPAERAKVMTYLEQERNDSRWEILQHDVGRGDHIHVGRRDFDWRARFSPPTPPKKP